MVARCVGQLLARGVLAEGGQQVGHGPLGPVQAELGAEAADHATPDGDPDQALTALRRALAARGYQPDEEADGTIRLRNCPFDRIAAHHRELVCGANHAMLQALTDQVGGDPPVRTVLDPQPGRCCVALIRER